MKRVLFVVDVSNVYYTVRNKFGPEKNLDFSRLIVDNLHPDEEKYRAIAYGSEIAGQAKGFKHMLKQFGFEPKYRETKIFTNSDGKEHRKGDVDVIIAMDVVRILDQVDVVVFVTADGDLAPCLEYVKSRGKICRVIGCGISQSLRNETDSCFEIEEGMLKHNA
jgi:uncharacterized LabA/DUF88 family protein